MKNYKQRMQSSYDQVAARFATVNAAMPPPVIRSAERLLHMIPEHAMILDIGCGHGRDIAWFAARGCRVTGVDLSLGMLLQAKQITSAPLLQMDMCVLAFRTQSYHAIWCNAALLHMPKSKAPRVLAEMHRILRPNGVLFFSLQGGTEETWENQSYGQTAPRFFARYSSEEVIHFVIDAGLTLHHQSESRKGPRDHWLHFFCTK